MPIILLVENIYFLEEFSKANNSFSLGSHSSYDLNIDSTWSFCSIVQLSWIDSIYFFQEYQVSKAFLKAWTGFESQTQSCVLRFLPMITALRGVRQENHEFIVILSNMLISQSVCPSDNLFQKQQLLLQ